MYMYDIPSANKIKIVLKIRGISYFFVSELDCVLTKKSTCGGYDVTRVMQTKSEILSIQKEFTSFLKGLIVT